MSGLSLTTIGLSGGDISFNETSSSIYTLSSIFRGGEFYIGDNVTNSFYSTNSGGPDVSGNIDITGGNLQIPVITSPNYYTFTLDLSNNNYTATQVDIPIFDQNLETSGLSNEVTFVQDSSGVYTSVGYFRGGNFYITDGSNNYYTTNAAAGDLSGNLDLSGSLLDITPLTSPSYYTVTVDLNTMTYTMIETDITVLGKTVTTSGLSTNLTFTEISGVYTSTGYFRGGNFYITDGTNSYYTTNATAGDLSGNLDLSGSNLDITTLTGSSYYTVSVNLNTMTYTITENAIVVTTIGLSPNLTFTEASGVYTSAGYFRGGNFYITDGSNNYYTTNTNAGDLSGNLDLSGSNLDITSLTTPNYYIVTVDLNTMTYTMVETVITVLGKTVTTSGLSTNLTFTEVSGVYTSVEYFRGGNFYITDGSNNYYTTNSAAGDLSGNLDLSGSNLDITPLTSPNYYTVTVDLNTMTYTMVETVITVTGKTVTTSGLSTNLTFTEASGVYTSAGYFRGGNFYITDGTNSYYTTNANAGDLSGNLDLSGSNLDITPLTSPSYYTVTVDLITMTYTMVETDITVTGQTVTTSGLSTNLTFTEVSGVYTSAGYFRGGNFYITDGTNSYYTTNANAGDLSGNLDLSGSNLDITPLTSPNYYTVTVDLNTMTYTIVETVITVTGKTVVTSGLSTNLTFTEVSGVYTSTGYFRGGNFYITDGTTSYYTTNTNAGDLSGNLDLSGNNLNISSLTSPSYYTLVVNLTAMTYIITPTNITVTGKPVATVGSSNDISLVQTSPGIYRSIFQGGNPFHITDGSYSYYAKTQSSLSGTLDLSGNNINIPFIQSPDYYTLTCNLTNMTFTAVATIDAGLQLKMVRTDISTNDISLNETSPGIYVGDLQGGNIYIANMNSPYNTYGSANQVSYGGDVIYDSMNVINISPLLTYPFKYTLTFDLTINKYSAAVSTFPRPNIPCFNEGSKILTNKGYVEIQNLRKGDLVQTSMNGFVPIDMIGYTQMEHFNNKERIKDQLYICTKNEYPEVFEDLIITGCHSILVDEFIENQREQTAELLTRIFVTDNKYRLPACLDKRAKVYEKKGTYTIYHVALENENYYKNYGVYANGLLVETCSKRYLKEISNMKLIE